MPQENGYADGLQKERLYCENEHDGTEEGVRRVESAHRGGTRAFAVRAFHSSNAFLGSVMLVLAVETFLL